jgi:hypothetical protein
MDRFVDAHAAGLLANPLLTGKYMAKSLEIGKQLVDDLDKRRQLRP